MVIIFGAGVIGSIYAMKFIEAGMDVTMFARSNRFKTLKENGLQYNDKGVVKSIKVNVIDTLENDDVYDFIFVTVRYDQAESALLALKDNQSKNIVTMTNNSIGFSSWLDIASDRLLPAFPGVGGQIKDGILYARIPPKVLFATMFGEISDLETERVKKLTKLFKTAKLPYTINKDMKSFLITHSVGDIALLCSLYFENKIIDEETARMRKTAHKITINFKAYLRAIQKADEVVKEIEANGGKAAAIQLDVSNISSFDSFASKLSDVLKDKWNREHFDFLINNAGISNHTPILEVTEEEFDKIVNVHFKGVFFLTQKLIPLIADKGGIVNTSTGLNRFT